MSVLHYKRVLQQYDIGALNFKDMDVANERKSENPKLQFYRDQLITLDDLETFKKNLILEIRNILKEFSGNPGKKWLKSYEVKKLLGISPGTLQNLRINGTLPFTKIGGVIFYDYEDIQKMISDRKCDRKFLGIR